MIPKEKTYPLDKLEEEGGKNDIEVTENLLL